MSATHVVVEATLNPDGSLELDRKLDLPPGRVQLIVQPLPELAKDDPFWEKMERIWADRAAAGLTAQSTEEDVETQRKALREEVDQEIERAAQFQKRERATSPDSPSVAGDNP